MSPRAWLQLFCAGTILAAIAVVSPAVAAEDAPETGKGLEALFPEVAAAPVGLDPGTKPFRNRLAVSPAFGWVGSQRLYTMRISYNPNPWLGYEASIGHNPGQAVQALFHMLSAVVRYPMPGRLQPYGTVGYGMILVFPGKSINADPATENTLSYGAGLEFYIRNDLALRAEARGLTVLGGAREQEGTVAYNYMETTFGLSFYREIGN